MKRKGISESLSLYGATCLLEALGQSIRKIREHSGEGPLSDGQQMLMERVCELQSFIMQKYSCPEETETRVRALLVLMDAYEISGEEEVLQFALTQAEKLLPVLDNSAQKCKLLAYCYYYTEDAECAREARHIIESWDPARYTEEMCDAAKCYQELA